MKTCSRLCPLIDTATPHNKSHRKIFLKQLLECTDEEQFSEFLTTDSDLDISDLLMSAGFPHITITPGTKQIAYECCLLYEVITKRVTALDDIRKGLQSVKVLGNTALDLLAKWPVLKNNFFPEARIEAVGVEMLLPRITYVTDENAVNRAAQTHFEDYISELSTRDGMCDIYFIT